MPSHTVMEREKRKKERERKRPKIARTDAQKAIARRISKGFKRGLGVGD